MPTFISLINWTEKGAASFADTVDRAAAVQALGEKFGVTMKDLYWTIGPYDMVATLESPDDESATAFALTLGSMGNIRTTTLRGFSADDMRGIIAKTG